MRIGARAKPSWHSGICYKLAKSPLTSRACLGSLSVANAAYLAAVSNASLTMQVSSPCPKFLSTVAVKLVGFTRATSTWRLGSARLAKGSLQQVGSVLGGASLDRAVSRTR